MINFLKLIFGLLMMINFVIAGVGDIGSPGPKFEIIPNEEIGQDEVENKIKLNEIVYLKTGRVRDIVIESCSTFFEVNDNFQKGHEGFNNILKKYEGLVYHPELSEIWNDIYNFDYDYDYNVEPFSLLVKHSTARSAMLRIIRGFQVGQLINVKKMQEKINEIYQGRIKYFYRFSSYQTREMTYVSRDFEKTYQVIKREKKTMISSKYRNHDFTSFEEAMLGCQEITRNFITGN